jgi:hypothetical protein
LLGDPRDRFCGSYRMYRLDGGPLPHDECPMADILRHGIPVRDQEVVIERTDGTSCIALVNIRPLRCRRQHYWCGELLSRDLGAPAQGAGIRAHAQSGGNYTGRVHIRWSIFNTHAHAQFSFRWHELGGPLVTPPTRKGFGSAVLEQVMAEYFGKPPQIEFAVDGITYEVGGALENISAVAASTSRSASS